MEREAGPFDLVVITAGNESQAEIFRKQLKNIDISRLAKNVLVVPDPPDAGRIGSGGSMIYLAAQLKKEIENIQSKCVLVFHSGGYAQRMPYQSVYGKCFSHLPGIGTILEVKTEMYSRIREAFPAGLVVTASDVIEDIFQLTKIKQQGENVNGMILYACESDIKTGTNHGVFVMNSSGKLQYVLQKPTEQEMRQNSALMKNGKVLVDSFYWMDWKLVSKLAELKGKRPIEQEICCYGDFMRPLGERPKLDYITGGSENLQAWRKDLRDIFAGVQNTIFNLGPDTFYHLGTHLELAVHLQDESQFRKIFSKFQGLKLGTEAIHSVVTVENCKGNTLVEFCYAPKAIFKENVIASGIRTDRECSLEDVMVFTVALHGQRFVTFAVPLGFDVKKTENELIWMGKFCEKNANLWKAAIFPVRSSREDSFDATYDLIHSQDIKWEDDMISMEKAVFEEADMDENLRYREEMKKNNKI